MSSSDNNQFISDVQNKTAIMQYYVTQAVFEIWNAAIPTYKIEMSNE